MTSIADRPLTTTDVTHPSWCDPERCLYGVEEYLCDSAHSSSEHGFSIEGSSFGVSLELVQYHGSAPELWVDDGQHAGGACTPDDLEVLGRWLIEQAGEYRAILAPGAQAQLDA